jgi:hypothetical protein
LGHEALEKKNKTGQTGSNCQLPQVTVITKHKGKRQIEILEKIQLI